MAGLDTKLSQLTETTDPTGGYMYIIIPDNGNFVSRKIAVPNVNPSSASARQIEKIVNQDSDDTFAVDAGTKVESIDFAHVSGSPLIKIGSSPGGSEYSLMELSVPSSDYLPVAINKIFAGASTIYISISGGTVNYNVVYIQNFF